MIHHHDLTRPQGGYQNGLHKRSKDLCIGTTLYRHRSQYAIARERAELHHMCACIHRGGCMDTRTCWRTSILACHSHIDACFIHKDIIVRITLVHVRVPGLALALDIVRIRLCRMRCLFFASAATAQGLSAYWTDSESRDLSLQHVDTVLCVSHQGIASRTQ